MRVVTFLCPPCEAPKSVSALVVRLTCEPAASIVCPDCATPMTVLISAGQWWQIVAQKADLLEELDEFGGQMAKVRTPADIVGAA